MWHDVGNSLCVCAWVPVRRFLCLYGRETHTKGLHTRSPTRSEEDGGRKVPEQSREETSQQKEAEQRSGQNKAVDRSEQSSEVEGSRPLGSVDPDARLANMRGWVSIPGDFLGISFKYTLAIAHRKVLQISPFLRLELTQARGYLFFFSSTHSVVFVVFCVSVKKCEIPLAEDERNH